jgi:hypothetical protein
MNEVELLRALRHRNIVTYIGEGFVCGGEGVLGGC